MTSTSTVFVSYARGDRPFVRDLVARLRESSIDVWVEADIPGGSRWDDEVERALKACTKFVVVLSPESVASINVKDEIAEALDRKVPIVPVLLRECDVPFRIKRLQRFDFSAGHEDFGGLVAALGEAPRAAMSEPSIAAPPAGQSTLAPLASVVYARLLKLRAIGDDPMSDQRQLDEELWFLGEEIASYEQALAKQPDAAHAAAVNHTRRYVVEVHDLSALTELLDEFARLRQFA